MVYVCDAIMGSGKSSAAINYMNGHPEKRFMYVTPYLDEGERIRRACPNLSFNLPSGKREEYCFSKCNHAAALIKKGKNIATTHSLLTMFTKEMMDDMRGQDYVLILDECINILETIEGISQGDMDVLVDAGYLKRDGFAYLPYDKEYTGTRFKDIFNILATRELMFDNREDIKTNNILFYWIISPELFNSFKDVYVLTYMFEGQGLYYFFKIYDIPYQSIGVKRQDGIYSFGDYQEYIPEYVYDLKNKIHIFYGKGLNDIGDNIYSLSKSWFLKHREDGGLEQLQCNIYNYFRNVFRRIDSSLKMWSTFESFKIKLRGKGYTKGFVPLNARATNVYKDKICLAYATNIFMPYAERKFYTARKIKIDEDAYALSTMIQWIWRSAIRNGHDIYIYVPSRRMRGLLKKWIDSFGILEE